MGKLYMQKFRTIHILLLAQGIGLEGLKHIVITLRGYELEARSPRNLSLVCVCVGGCLF